MSEPFIGEVRIFPYSFRPKNWAWCNGTLVPLVEQQALYSVIQTIYGGDGYKNFALPNLVGRAPMHYGQGKGLTPRPIGQTTGSETVTLTESQMAYHTHGAFASKEYSESVPRATSYPGKMCYPTSGKAQKISGYNEPDRNDILLQGQSIAPAGCDKPYIEGHENCQPSLGIYFFIALAGEYPQRPS